MLTLPAKIGSASDFEKSVLTIRQAYTGSPGDQRFLNMMYYLLGWLVGDAGKNFSTKHPWARVELDLSRKHPQNLPLGNFVMNCISSLGVTCGRIRDGPPRVRDNYGMYRWMSYFSEVFVWFYTACLGPDRDQLTSYDPVRMDWLLTASTDSIQWFLRGIADSDGTVNVRNKTVEITSEPNGPLFARLFSKVGVRARLYKSKGFDCVSISVSDAARIQIFNPEVENHRGVLLQKLASARTFQARWPPWLEKRVDQLFAEHTDVSVVRNTLLFEDDTYVTLRTLKSKLARIAN